MKTLVDALRQRAEDEPDRAAFVFLEDGEVESARLTAAALDRRARAVAVALLAAGAPGDRALLCYPSGPDFVAAYYGCLYAGVIPVPCHLPARRRPDPRFMAIAADAGARLALSTDRVPRARDLPAETGIPDLRWLWTSDVDPAGADRWRPPSIGPDTLALLQYTSGSTADPRGVMVSHANLLHNIRDLRAGWELSSDSVMVTWVPVFHDLGLILGLLQPLVDRFLCVMMPPAAFLQRPVRWLRAISRYRGTHAAAPNFAFDLCASRVTPEQLADLDLSSVRMLLNAAEPIRPDTLERFTAVFSACGLDPEALCPGYGLAEATIKVTTHPVRTPRTVVHVDGAALGRHRVSLVASGSAAAAAAKSIVGCGVPVPETILRIVDPETAEACPPDRIGEVWIGGRTVAQGYWNNARATRETFGARIAGSGEGPFLRTGDLGFLRDGELFITGRLKDMVIVRGLNHYPQDIERTVEAAHPALSAAGAAAFGLEEDGTERLVVAVEVQRTKRSDLDHEAVFAAIRREVFAEHGLPVHAIALLKPTTLPKTSSGKVRRKACRAAFLADELAALAVWRAGGPDAPAPTPAPLAETTEDRIRDWLVRRCAGTLRLSPSSVDARAPFSLHQIDSVEAVSIAGELSEWLGRPLPPALLYDYPTIDALAGHLAHPDADVERPGEHRAASPSGPIAVVGLGCRFPGARGPAELWALLRDGVDAVTEQAPAWRSDGGDAPESTADGVTVSRAGGFLDEVDLFDAAFFGISPREAEQMDPQQRLLLEVGWEALEDAGIAAEGLAGTRTGVFVGISNSDYARMLCASDAADDIHVGTGSALSIAANRLSYALDLRGPSLAIDTACSSSLVAIALACESLRRGEADLVLAGGVNLVLSSEYTRIFAEARMLAADGRCKTFDASADGYVRGEGVGVVVLKRLADAERDGDRIVAVVRGVAVNQDGRTAGLTAPNGPAQRAVIRAALGDAGIPPARVSYVEAHGTGTALGDPIEVNALAGVLVEGREPAATCHIGSVKTNIGHLESAAGIAGFIKTVLMLVHREIPPTLHCRVLNPGLEIAGTPIRIPTRREPWSSDGPRVAGVSSFGFGGTNAHVVLEEYAAPERTPLPERPTHLLALSARDVAALGDVARRYADFLDAHPGVPFAEVCAAANGGRAALEERLALVSASSAEAVEKLRAWARGEGGQGVWQRRAERPSRVAFLFTGVGSQYPGMGRDLYRAEPVFRAAMDRCAEILDPLLGASLIDLLYGDAPAPLEDMRLGQPAIVALECALTRLWASFGVTPAVVVGHSLGEYAAACAAGALTLEDALTLVAARGRLIDSAARGTMIAAMASRDVVEDAIAPWRADLSIAAVNGPASVVFSGARAAAEAAARALSTRGVKCRALPIAHALHSPLLDPILEAFAAEAAGRAYGVPRVPLVSTLTGTWKPDAADAAYWARHLRAPVLFGDALATVVAAGYRVFVEIGALPTLVTLGAQTHGDETYAWLASLHREDAAHRRMLGSLAALWTRGLAVAWAGVDGPRSPGRVRPPTYPFQRRRYWVRGAMARQGAARGSREHPLLGRRVHLAGSDDVVFETTLSPASAPWVSEHRALGTAVLPMAAYLEMVIAAAGGGGPWLVEHVALLRALTLDEDRIVQTVLSPDGPGGWSWRVWSRREETRDPEWSLHATGRVRRAGARAGDPVDIVALQARTPSVVDAGSFYDDLARRGIELGPSYRLISDLRCGEREAVATVGAGDAPDPHRATYAVHPFLLDAALQVATATLSASAGRAAYGQSGIERLRIEGPLPSTLRCHARRVEGAGAAIVVDLRMTDEDGRVVAEAEGLAYLPADREALTSGVGDLYRIEWIEGRPARAVGTASRPLRWLILADEGGTGAALAALLRGRGHRCVVARRGESYAADAATETVRVRPTERADHARLLVDAAATLGGSPDLIAHLWSLDARESLTVEALRDAFAVGAESAVWILQSLLGEAAPARLWLVTRKAQAVDGAPSDAGVVQSPIWGIGKSIALEHPECWGGLVDLDAESGETSASRLAAEILATDDREREDHVAFRDGRRLVARVTRTGARVSRPIRLVADATYLITGGLGSLGLAVAARMVGDGARHLVLVGRRGASTERQRAAVRSLEVAGAVVRALAVDVRDASAVASLLQEIRASLPPLRGVVHAAGSAGHRALSQMTGEALDETFGAKAEGALVLRQATRELALEFFACVSSMASAWGAHSLAHYVAANQLLDVLAEHDRGAGRPAVAIGLGPLRGGMLPAGMADELERMGAAGWEMERAAGVVVRLLGEDRGAVVAADIDWTRFRAVLESRSRRPILERLGSAPVVADHSPDSRGRLAERLAHVPVRDRERLLTDAVLRQAARALGLEPAQWPDLRRGFFDLGMTSLTALEMRRGLEADLARSLPATLVFDHPNVEALGTFLGRVVFGPTDAADGVAVRGEAVAVRAEVTDGDLEAMLAAKLERLEGLVGREPRTPR